MARLRPIASQIKTQQTQSNIGRRGDQEKTETKREEREQRERGRNERGNEKTDGPRCHKVPFCFVFVLCFLICIVYFASVN